MNATAPAIEARGLVKRYGDLTAVDGIDLRALPGQCLGLLGPNGAGKTTTIEILEGLMPADAGEVRILGLTWKDSGRALRRRIGVQLQETQMPDKLTVQEILEMFRCFHREGREIDDVLDLVALREKRRARTSNLSGGQRQRLALGVALVGAPEILFLDEPTTGLDPQARRRVWEIVEDFKGQGGTVLLTTHYMDEAERLSDDLLIIDHGKAIAAGSPAAIIASLEAESIVSFEAGSVEIGRFSALPGVVQSRIDAGRVELSARSTDELIQPLLEVMRGLGVEVADLRIHRPTLEDVFVHLTGRHLRDA